MADGFTFLLETDRPLAHGGTGKSLGYAGTFPVDIPGAVGGKTAYIGFTGGAGTKSMTEQILKWTFSNP